MRSLSCREQRTPRQIAASVGFTVYSWLVRNRVFVATNALMLLNGLAGYAIVLRHRRRERARREKFVSMRRNRASER